MAERLLCKQEVDGSIPFVSTIKCLVSKVERLGARRGERRCDRFGRRGLWRRCGGVTMVISVPVRHRIPCSALSL